MTITNEQIVLAESQVMADTDDGGGRMSGNVVEDGAVNNTMPDISRLDRVYGRVNMRKLFLSVRSANQDTLLGSHSILLRQPLDPRVGVSLFQTGSHTDRREDAQNKLESYLTKATEARFWLWGDQLEGQRAIACLQRLDAAPPEQGETYCLVEVDENGNDVAEQYVRVTEVEVGRETFTEWVNNAYVDFELQTLNISLASQLQRDFSGSEPRPTGKQQRKAKTLRTQVADAARYYGAKKLSATASPGDQTASVETVYNNLVPSAQSENALTDRQAGPGRLPVIPASNNTITIDADDVSVDPDGYAVYYCGRAIVPGSLTIAGSNGNYTDEGGILNHTSGSNLVEASTVDYAEGVVRIKYSGSQHSNPITLTFTPGAALFQQAYTLANTVSQQNRSLTWVHQLAPIPAPGTLVIEYRALGRWATITDSGNGVLTGDGVGRINFETGTIEVTLAGLPDVDTQIIYSWGDALSAEIEDGSVASPQAYFKVPFTGTI
ncbi:hypothetical protein [Gilvimarinus sp. 1_MG-2023]|uniref:hypothetical protein n=1 Tax=Gilvimarinus sp. 1_MG-2023 TaxID=3062638 RepID=UPI0026E2FBC5|nr:hypothetical protein [Gilvimarinus sp. 1_MG-2023]MDO6747215.1 hypothetical protein [Gilvimarinus sp. 1_MG-2023]